jgi:multiple sugar transport system permease protein
MTALTPAMPRNAVQRERERNKARKRLLRIFTIYIPVIIILMVMLLPFYWMVVTSLKPYPEMLNVKINPFFPQKPTLEHYVQLLTQTRFPTWFGNTVYVSVISTVISVALSVMAGYSLARLRYKGRAALSSIIFIAYLVPTTLLFIPMFEVVKQLGLYNSKEALIAVYPTFLMPFCTWLLLGYFRTIPPDLEECAMIDGATRWQSFRLITLPLATPGVVTAGIFAFTLSWNEFIYSLVLISNDNSRTIPVGVVTKLVQGDLYFWGPLMAAALIGSVPVVILFSFFVEQYVAGLTAGAVKG